MPTEPRGEIGDIKPSGWHTVRYDDLIEDRYLYNRCHLIAFSLAGENDNPQNLITGTRYFNTAGMLPYEIQVAQYVESHHAHVLYRVTPIYENDNLLASGVKIEACSVEDIQGFLHCWYSVFKIHKGVSNTYPDSCAYIVPQRLVLVYNLTGTIMFPIDTAATSA